MESDHSDVGGQSIERTLAIASAIAERMAKTANTHSRISAELSGEPYVEQSPEKQRAHYLGRVTLLLAHVENPNTQLSLTNLLDATHQDGEFAELARDVSEATGQDITADGIKDISHGILGEIQNRSGYTDEKLTQDFAKMYIVAQEVAVENGVDITDVYGTDDLYYEALRRSTPEAEAAEEYTQVIAANSTEMFIAVLEQQAKSLFPTESAEEMSELLLEMRHDEGIRKEFEEVMAPLMESTRQNLLYSFIRTYGYNAVNNLTHEQREQLLPKFPLAKVLSDLITSCKE